MSKASSRRSASSAKPARSADARAGTVFRAFVRALEKLDAARAPRSDGAREGSR
jgi:hypothetical protein